MDLNSKSQWNEHTAQQLVRYEALFRLLDDIQPLEDIQSISRQIARQSKYFANIASFRLVVPKENRYLIIDGFRGEALISETKVLPPWDAHHLALQLPRLIRMREPLVGPAPPEHLAGRSTAEIEVIPFVRSQRCIGILSVAGRLEPFTDMDSKFIRIFGSHCTDRIFDILMRQQTMEILVNKATRDALTDLLNRGAIIERLARQLELARGEGRPMSVILADIDFFKAINDNYGHLAGDAVLREVASRLRAQTLSGDHLGRYGGEEFLFVLYPCGAEEVVQAAERFRRAIEQPPICIGNDTCCHPMVTISLGTASTAGCADVRMESLLKQADDALYLSKMAGRNRVTAGQSNRTTAGAYAWNFLRSLGIESVMAATFDLILGRLSIPISGKGHAKPGF